MIKNYFFRILFFSLLPILTSCSKDDVDETGSKIPNVTLLPFTSPKEIQNIQNEAISKVITPLRKVSRL